MGITGSAVVALPFVIDIGPYAFISDLLTAFSSAAVPSPQRTSVTLDAVLLQFGAEPIPRVAGMVMAVATPAGIIAATRRIRCDTSLSVMGIMVALAFLFFAPYAHINYLWPIGMWALWLAFAPRREAEATITSTAAATA